MIRVAHILIISVLVANSGFAQTSNNGEIVPSDSFVVDGIPKIPTSLAQAVNRYTHAWGFRVAGSPNANCCSRT